MSEYKRLTERDEYGNADIIGVDSSNWQFNLTFEELVKVTNALNTFAKLEDKIENGTLIELPCKVGDIVYEVIKGLPIQEWEIISIDWSRTYGKNYVMWGKRKRDLAHWKFWREDFGKTLFLTKAEAEARLKELQEKEECR